MNDVKDLLVGIQGKPQYPFTYHILESKQNLHISVA